MPGAIQKSRILGDWLADFWFAADSFSELPHFKEAK
jgi:hypothetical protein